MVPNTLHNAGWMNEWTNEWRGQNILCDWRPEASISSFYASDSFFTLFAQLAVSRSFALIPKKTS